MRSVLKTVAGLTVATLIFLLLAIRFILDAIGYTTSPDDLALLQARLPKVLEWLFSTPWWVPTLFMAGMIGLAAWLLVSGLRGIAFEPVAEGPGSITAADIEAAITRRAAQLQSGSGGVTFDYVDEAIKLRLGDMFRDTVAETFEASDARAGSMIDHFEKRCDGILDTIEKLAGSTSKVDNELFDRIAELKKLIGEWERKFDLWAMNKADDLDRRFDNVDQSLRAMLYREWHHRLVRELDDEYEALARPIKAGEGIADWEKWDREERSWRGKLDQWLSIAEYYAVNTADKVRDIPDSMFYGNWTFDEKTLANADQVCRYKELSILWHNVEEAKPRVDRCFQQTCFFGASKIGRIGPPPPSLD